MVRAAPSHGEGSEFESREDDHLESRMAQWLAHHLDMVGVSGSSPLVRTILLWTGIVV